MSKEKTHNMASCMLSILDSIKLYDNDSLELGDETLSQVMFRKMDAYNINLNDELGFTHLKPVDGKDIVQEEVKTVAEKIVVAVNKTTNDYDAREKVLEILESIDE